MEDLQYYTVKEVCERLKLSRAQVSRYIARGKLPSVKFGRTRRIPREGLREFCERYGKRTEARNKAGTMGNVPSTSDWFRRIIALRETIREEVPDFNALECFLEAREELAE